MFCQVRATRSINDKGDVVFSVELTATSTWRQEELDKRPPTIEKVLLLNLVDRLKDDAWKLDPDGMEWEESGG